MAKLVADWPRCSARRIAFDIQMAATRIAYSGEDDRLFCLNVTGDSVVSAL